MNQKTGRQGDKSLDSFALIQARYIKKFRRKN